MKALRRSPKRNARRQPVGRQAAARPSSASPGYSYYAQQRTEPTSNTGRQLSRAAGAQAKRVGHFWLPRFGLAILLAVVILSVINGLLLNANASVMPLTTSTSRNFLQPLSVYQSAADKLLASSVWNHNKVTINTGAISRSMLKQFPELSTVSVSLPLLGHRPILYIEPDQPALLLMSGNAEYALATSGRALEIVNRGDELTKHGLPVVVDQSNLALQLGQPALPSQNVTFILTVLTELRVKHFTPTSLTLPAATGELDVHLKNQPYFIKFNLENNDPRQQSGTFLATIANLHDHNVTPKDYIDVRVDGRAYYK
ncbi:MAG TPA: hypothetical protein VG992_03630 [Candidatus Saccharimonadales bacterium]|nr:hypothetical protein [Candidatus Saccharimonadales bacterium]